MSLAKIPSRTDYVDEVYKTLINAISAGNLKSFNIIKKVALYPRACII